MKFAFILMCVLCAILLSVISAIMVTGRVPGHPPPAPPVAAAEPAKPEPLTVFSDSGQAVEQLIEALKNEKDLYATKTAELATRAEELKLQEDLLARLKTELQELQVRLDENIYRIDQNELGNMRRLSEVCSKMDAASAADSLMEMDKERAAQLLFMMNERRAAAIMDAAVAKGDQGPAVVAQWADIIRRLQNERNKDKAKKGAG